MILASLVRTLSFWLSEEGGKKKAYELGFVRAQLISQLEIKRSVLPPGARDLREELWPPLPRVRGHPGLHRRHPGEDHFSEKQPSYYSAG